MVRSICHIYMYVATEKGRSNIYKTRYEKVIKQAFGETSPTQVFIKITGARQF